MASKDSGNMSVTLPKAITDEIDQFVKKNPRYMSRSNLIKHILNQWIDEAKKPKVVTSLTADYTIKKAKK